MVLNQLAPTNHQTFIPWFSRPPVEVPSQPSLALGHVSKPAAMGTTIVHGCTKWRPSSYTLVNKQTSYSCICHSWYLPAISILRYGGSSKQPSSSSFAWHQLPWFPHKWACAGEIPPRNHERSSEKGLQLPTACWESHALLSQTP